MQIKQSVRIQTSLLNGLEKRLLVWMAERMPRWVSSDMMTAIGVQGALLCGVGFALTNYSIYWLWLSCIGLALNWFGDSLDGTIARVRQQQRPLYGYYIDHNMDTITEAMMFIGAGLSPLMNMGVALGCYAAYLAITVYVSINAHLKNEFKLTYGKLGPTEFRLIIFVVNILLMYVPSLAAFGGQFDWFGQAVYYGALDIVGVGILLILIIIYFVSFVKDALWFARRDPLPRKDK